MIRSIGLVGVSMNRYFVFGVIAGSISSRLRGVDVGEVEPELAADALEQPERAAVGVVAHHHVVAGLEPGEDSVDGGHARGEGEAGHAGFDGREVALERHSRRILRAAVLVALVLAQALLDVGGGLVNRRDDGARGWVGLLAGMNADGAEPCACR